MVATRITPHRGFTLIELLVVIVIIAILAALMFPIFTKAIEKAHQSTCSNNQRQLAIGILAYAQDNDEMLPTPVDWIRASGLAGDTKVFNCPTSALRGSPAEPDYGYNAYLADYSGSTGSPMVQLSLGAIALPNDTEVVTDRSEEHEPETAGRLAPIKGAFAVTGYEINGDPRHNGGIISAYLDGHVNVMGRREYGRVVSEYSLPITRQYYIDFSLQPSAAAAATALLAFAKPLSGSIDASKYDAQSGVYNLDCSIELLGTILMGNVGVMIECDYTNLQIYPAKVSTIPKELTRINQNIIQVFPDTQRVGFGCYDHTAMIPTGTAILNHDMDPRFLGRYESLQAAGDIRITLSLGEPTGGVVSKSSGSGIFKVDNVTTDSYGNWNIRPMQCTVSSVTGTQKAHFKQMIGLTTHSQQGTLALYRWRRVEGGTLKETGTIKLKKIMVAY